MSLRPCNELREIRCSGGCLLQNNILELNTITLAHGELVEPCARGDPDMVSRKIRIVCSTYTRIIREDICTYIEGIERITDNKSIRPIELDAEFLERGERCRIIDLLALHELRDHSEISAVVCSVIRDPVGVILDNAERIVEIVIRAKVVCVELRDPQHEIRERQCIDIDTCIICSRARLLYKGINALRGNNNLYKFNADDILELDIGGSGIAEPRAVICRIEIHTKVVAVLTGIRDPVTIRTVDKEVVFIFTVADNIVLLLDGILGERRPRADRIRERKSRIRLRKASTRREEP